MVDESREDFELNMLMRDCLQSGLLKAVDMGLRLFDVMEWASEFSNDEILYGIEKMLSPEMANIRTEKEKSEDGKSSRIRQKRQ